MKAVSKAQLLEQLECRIERHLYTITCRFQNLDDKTLLQPAQNGGWSIAQCLEHLNSYARYYLPAIENGMNKTSFDHPETGTVKGTWLGAYFTRSMEPSSTAKKYKAPKDHTPVPTLDTVKVIGEFIAQQEQLLRQIRKAKLVNLDAVHIPISISRWIKLRLGDVFRFLVAHNERHIQQALRHLPVS